jgi:hypothetical protein
VNTRSRPPIECGRSGSQNRPLPLHEVPAGAHPAERLGGSRGGGLALERLPASAVRDRRPEADPQREVPVEAVGGEALLAEHPQVGLADPLR